MVSMFLRLLEGTEVCTLDENVDILVDGFLI